MDIGPKLSSVFITALNRYLARTACSFIRSFFLLTFIILFLGMCTKDLRATKH